MEQKLYTLKLDASWRAIEIIDAYKGFNLAYSGRATIVEHHPYHVTKTAQFPSVIVLKSYISNRNFALSCNRRNVAWAYKNVCQYCGRRFQYSDLTMDHVIPKCKGGEFSWSNIVISCKKCNTRKGYKSVKEANMKLLCHPRPPKVTIREYYRNIKFYDSWSKFIN